MKFDFFREQIELQVAPCLIDPWNFHMFFLKFNIPGNLCPPPSVTCLDFSGSGTGIAHHSLAHHLVSKLPVLLSFPHLAKRFQLIQIQIKIILNKKNEKQKKKKEKEKIRTKRFTLRDHINNDKLLSSHLIMDFVC